MIHQQFVGIKTKEWRGWDLNPQPMAYESTAPPLSYLATAVQYYYEGFLLSITAAEHPVIAFPTGDPFCIQVFQES